MNQSELEKRYRSKVRFWYLKFERLSNQNDELQKEIERLGKIVDKNAGEIFQIVTELQQLKQQSEKMEFDHIELEQ